jgi:multidrug efflux system membrane fusion protein
MARPLAFVLPALLLGVAALAGCNRDQAKPPAPPPQKVLYVKPVTNEVTEYEEFTGRTAAVETVELRARVSGYLDKISFEDGDDVEKGKLLFTIDNRPFIAEEARTAAAVKQAQAKLSRLDRQFKRAETLFKKEAISTDEYETIKFDREEADASLNAAKAQHEVADLNLDFTKVTAPISGRIGRRMVDAGNLVTADITALATIVPLDKVYVYFDMDERTVLRLRNLIHDKVIMSPTKEDVTVDIALADSPEFKLTGIIDFQDNQIDPATGTLRVRATVDNPDDLLSPGLFVRLRYPIGKPGPQLMIPEESLGSDQGQPFVFVIEKGEIEVDGEKQAVDKVVARRVELGPQVGGKRVIREGLQLDERIVVTGLQRIRRNAVVTPEERKPEPSKTEALAAEKKHRSAKTAPKLISTTDTTAVD